MLYVYRHHYYERETDRQRVNRKPKERQKERKKERQKERKRNITMFSYVDNSISFDVHRVSQRNQDRHRHIY